MKCSQCNNKVKQQSNSKLSHCKKCKQHFRLRLAKPTSSRGLRKSIPFRYELIALPYSLMSLSVIVASTQIELKKAEVFVVFTIMCLFYFSLFPRLTLKINVTNIFKKRTLSAISAQQYFWLLSIEQSRQLCKQNKRQKHLSYGLIASFIFALLVHLYF